MNYRDYVEEQETQWCESCRRRSVVVDRDEAAVLKTREGDAVHTVLMLDCGHEYYWQTGLLRGAP